MTTGILMVIQFSRPLSAQDISELRTVHHLRLDAYQPERSYLERIDATRSADWSTTRALSRSGRIRPRRSEAGSRPGRRRDRRRLWATLFDDGDPADLLGPARAEAVTSLSTTTGHRAAGLGLLHARLRRRAPPGPGAPRRGPDRDAACGHDRRRPGGGSRGHLDGDRRAVGTWPARGGPGDRHDRPVSADRDHCFFRDEPNEPGPAHRKLVAMRSASGSPLAGKHSTLVAGCAAGDAIDQLGQHPDRGAAWAARLAARTFSTWRK